MLEIVASWWEVYLKPLSYRQVLEFCEATSLHGLKYITDPDSHCVERIFWIVLVILSIFFEIMLILPIIEKFHECKTITTVDTTNYPIWNIDFPGITVCSNIRVANSLFESTMSRYPWKNLTEADQSYGVGQVVTNLVKFLSDPDLIYFQPRSETVLSNYSDHITPLMAMVMTIIKHIKVCS